MSSRTSEDINRRDRGAMNILLQSRHRNENSGFIVVIHKSSILALLFLIHKIFDCNTSLHIYMLSLIDPFLNVCNVELLYQVKLSYLLVLLYFLRKGWNSNLSYSYSGYKILYECSGLFSMPILNYMSYRKQKDNVDLFHKKKLWIFLHH